MKRYFIHQLKTHSRAIIIITVLMILISVFGCLGEYRIAYTRYFVDDGEKIYNVWDYNEYNKSASYYNDDNNKIIITNEKIIEVKYYSLLLTYPVVILIILSIVVPAWMFGFMKKKRNLDCLYSLPITKRGIGVVQYLLGIIAVFVPFVSSYAVIIIDNISYGLFGNIAHEYLVAHFIVCLIAGFVIYSLSCFAFERANSVIDGIIMIGVYLVVLYFIAFSVGSIINKTSYFIFRAEFDETIKNGIIPSTRPESFYLRVFEERGIPFVAFGELLDTLKTDAEWAYSSYTTNFLETPSNIFWLVLWCVIGLLSAFGVIYGFDKKKAESAEEISNSIFSYKLLIPFTFILSNINYAIFRGDTTACISMTVACIVAYTIYRRGVKYKKSDYIVMGIMISLTICSLFVFDTITQSFVYNPYEEIWWD